MRRILCPLALALPLVGCGGDGNGPVGAPPTEARPPAAPVDTVPGERGTADRVTVRLEEHERTGVSGTAELTPEEGGTAIAIELDAADEGAWTPYLQEGDCTAVRAEAAEVLPLFLEGRSETVVDAELPELLNGRFVLSVHDDEGDLLRPAACGEIRAEGS